MRGVQDIVYGVAGQLIFHDAQEGRAGHHDRGVHARAPAAGESHRSADHEDHDHDADDDLPERKQQTEQRVGREAHAVARDALGVDESRAGARELVQATLDLVRGLGLANTISDDAARRARILDRWALTLDAALARTPDDTPDAAPEAP